MTTGPNAHIELDHTRAGQAVRQGDVLILPIKSVPSNTVEAVRAEDGGHRLALGEVTGHHHSVYGGNIARFRPDDSGSAPSDTYLDVKEAAPVTHQEHHARNISVGANLVRIQRVVHSGIARQVQD